MIEKPILHTHFKETQIQIASEQMKPKLNNNTSFKQDELKEPKTNQELVARPLQHRIEPLKEDLSMLPDATETSYENLLKTVSRNDRQKSRKVSTGSDKPFVEDESANRRQHEKSVRYQDQDKSVRYLDQDMELSRESSFRDRSKSNIEERRTQTNSILKKRDKTKESLLEKSIMEDVANKSNIELFSNVVAGYCDNISISVRRKLMSAGQSID